MRKFILFLISTIFVGIVIGLSIPQVRAILPPRFDPTSRRNARARAFAFIVAEICGFIAGVSTLTLGAKEEGGRSARIIIFAMIISYLPAYLIWETIYISRVFSDSPNFVLQAVVITLIPEVLGTGFGTVFIRKTLEVKWKWALLSMGALMLSSFLVGQLLYTYTYKAPRGPSIYLRAQEIPVRLGMGFFVDGYYINRDRLDAMWTAEKFYMNDDGSFAINLKVNYTASEPPSVEDLEYVGSGFLMIVDAVYSPGPFRFSRKRLSGLISVIANSVDSRSCIIDYEGSFDFPNEMINLRYLEVQFSWIRVFQDNYGFYFQWVQGNISEWVGETNKVYQDITGGFLACHPLPEDETNYNLLSRDFPGFNYVEWLKENL